MDFSKIQHCLITHSHRDHFYPEDLYNLAPGHSHPPQDWVLHIYGNKEISEQAAAATAKPVEEVRPVFVEPFVPFSVGRYTVTALKARHGSEAPYVYAIGDGEKTILYAHDTDIFGRRSANISSPAACILTW